MKFKKIDEFFWEELKNEKSVFRYKLYAKSMVDDVLYLQSKFDLSTKNATDNIMTVLLTHKADIDKDGRPQDTLYMISEFTDQYNEVHIIKGEWSNN